MAKGRPDLAVRVEPAIASDRRGAPRSLITDLVVLTDSEEFQSVLKQSVSNQQRVWRVPTTDQAAELLAAGRVGVLVVDTECVPRGAPSLINHLNLEFPDLVVVVAGTHEEVPQFAHLVGEGLVYRFLQKPVSPGRVRAFIDAAVRRHAELVAEAPAAVIARKKRPGRSFRGYALLALIGVAAFAAYEYWHRPSAATVSGDRVQNAAAPAAGTEPAAAPAIAPASIAPAPAAPALRQADPRDLAALERAVAGQPALRPATSVGTPARSTKPVLQTQSDSGAPPEAAVPDHSAEVTTAPVADNNVEQLVRGAQRAMAAGNLVEPDGSSAKSLLTNALKLDPGNAAAKEAYGELQSQVIAQAQVAVKAPDPVAANRWISEAQSLGITDAELLPLRRALDAASERQRSDRLSGLARLAVQRIADDKLIEPAGDNARQYLKQLQTEDAALATPLWQQFTERALSKAKREASQGNYEAADRWLKEADDTGALSASVATVRADVQAARARTAFLANVVPSSQLKSKKFVAATYPPKALSQGLEGYVDLEFTVDTNGAVRDISVRNAVPTGAFEKAAVDALARWRFEPVQRNGTTVEQRSAVRMQFKLDR